MPEVDLFGKNTTKLSPTAQKKVALLERVIPHLDTLYDLGEDCIHPDTGKIVPDIEYDKMRAELAKLKPNSKVFKGVTASLRKTDAKKLQHDPPLTSISKANGELKEKQDRLKKWCNDMASRLGVDPNKTEDWAVQTYKHDGVACAIYYKDGKLVKAGLRPRDGVNGEDVSLNVEHVNGIPKKLPLPITCSIRGELECKISVFNSLNGTNAVDNQEFANPRNYTSGSIRQFKNPYKTKSRQLSFTGYSIEAFEDYKKYYRTESERAKWCNKTLKVPFVRVEPFKISDLQKMEDNIVNLDYEVDGIVLSVNDLESQEQAGREGDQPLGNPRGKLAWKFADDIADSPIEDIVWQVGRTGKITPVIEIKEVKLAGTRVNRCAGYSLGYLLRNKVSVGMKVRVRKSGKIIPESLGFFDAKGNYYKKLEPGDENIPKKLDLDSVSYPRNCPSCDEKTETEDGQKPGMVDLFCRNDHCPAKRVRHFLNYLQKFGVKGLGESLIEDLVGEGVIRTFADLYTLKVSDAFDAIGSKRLALLSVARIHMIDDAEKEQDNRVLAKRTIEAMKSKKKIPLAQFISCLGISGVSKGGGRAVASHFKNFDDILTASVEDFEAVEDVGAKTAKSLHKYFQDNKDEIKQLLNHVELELPKIGKFTNKTFVFTGGLPEGKDKWKKAVEDEGAKVSSSVSKKTDYVVIGQDPGQKADKARDLVAQGVKTLTILDFDGLKVLLK